MSLLSDKVLLHEMNVCVYVDHLVLGVGEPAASQGYWIETGARTRIAA